MRVIAIEEHWNTPEIAQALDRLPPKRRAPSTALNHLGDSFARLLDLGPARLAAMDEQGVDVQVLGLAPPATSPLDPHDAVALSRAANDVAADAVRRHPTRLRAMATLPLSAPGAAIQELERASGIGLAGAMVYGRAGDVPLDDPRMDDVLAAAAEYRHPLYLHPQIAPAQVRAAYYAGFDSTAELLLATAAWGWHVDAAVAALRLIVRGCFDRHPDLQVVLGHWGELLLFWQDRVKSLAGVAGLDQDVSEYLRSNFYISNSGMMSPTLLRHALEATSPDRLVFSTDYPFQRPSRTDLETLLSQLPDDRTRQRFLSGNAHDLFRIDALE